ncbi:MAG: GWxTD domain-containing protein [bacterium]
MKRYYILFILCLYSIIFSSENELGFIYDYSIFPVPGDDKSFYLEIYFGIPCNQLEFEEKDGLYWSDVLIGFRLIDEKENLILLDDIERVSKQVMTVDETSSEKFLLDQLTYKIEGGEYIFEVGVTDIKSKKTGTSTSKIKVVSETRGKQIYDIQLASNIFPSDDNSNIFYKNGLIVIPNPSRIFRKPVNIPLYMEVGDLREGREAIEYIIANASGEVKWSMKQEYSVKNRTVIVSILQVGSLEVGLYQLIVKLGDIEKRKTFVVFEEGYESELALLLFNKSLPAYTEEEAIKVREEIGIIASKDEMSIYDVLSLDLKPYFIERFWKKRDPTPTTEVNELKDEFYKRLEYVKEHFAISNKKGWDTDMGRIYIKYGPPDDIAREPSGISSMPDISASTFETEPTEAWEYHSKSAFAKGAIFIFVDFDGDGEYNIFASTEPGYGKLITRETSHD